MTSRGLLWGMALSLVMWLLIAVLVVRVVQAQEVGYTSDDTLQAIEEASAEIGVSAAYLDRIVSCETGGTYNPYSVGRQGELGAVQLHPQGELRRFYAIGYEDPYSPYQAVRFLAQRIVAGGARAWSCA